MGSCSARLRDVFSNCSRRAFTRFLLALHHARLQRVEPAVNFALVRHGDLRRVRRRRRPCIGNKIGDRHVGLMPDGGDDRNVGGINRARHALIVERPQIFNRPAAAPRDDEVGDLPFVCVAQRACDLRRRLCSPARAQAGARLRSSASAHSKCAAYHAPPRPRMR